MPLGQGGPKPQAHATGNLTQGQRYTGWEALAAFSFGTSEGRGYVVWGARGSLELGARGQTRPPEAPQGSPPSGTSYQAELPRTLGEQARLSH